jgi:osmotically-inducible protein OsmY
MSTPKVSESVNDNEVIAERVRNRIEQNTWANLDQIQVVVNDGYVTLSGIVSDYPLSRAVYQAAFNTVGVKSIQDKLVIRNDKSPQIL